MNQIPSDNEAMNIDQAPSNPSRRRLARGGMALPVVLASITGRNAFAATPYLCTVSGKLSGNMSLFGPNKDSSADCTLRASRSELIARLETDQTTFSFVFGDMIYANGDNDTADKLSGQPFKSTDAAKRGPLSRKGSYSKIHSVSQTDPPPQEATLHQVLKVDTYVASSMPKDREFMRMAIVAFANATEGPSDLYPLTRQQVIAMYKAAGHGLDYRGRTSMGDFTWGPSEVRRYFEHLYH